MAVPDQQFQTIIEQIEESVKEAIAKTLGNQPSSPKPTTTPAPAPTQDLNALREEIMEDVKTEMLTLRQEIAKLVVGNQQQAPQQYQATPPQKTPAFDRWMQNIQDSIDEGKKGYQELPAWCPEPYPEGWKNFSAQMAWAGKWGKWYKNDNSRKRKYASAEEIAYLMN